MNGGKRPGGAERWWPDHEGLVNHCNDFGFTLSIRQGVLAKKFLIISPHLTKPISSI